MLILGQKGENEDTMKNNSHIDSTVVGRSYTDCILSSLKSATGAEVGRSILKH